MAFRPNPDLARDLLASRAVSQAGQTLADEALAYAVAHAPVDTGAYRDALHVEEASDETSRSWRVVNNDWKAWLVETGTADTPAFRVIGNALHSIRRHLRGTRP